MSTISKPAITISEKGLELIKSFEGLVLHPYLDSVLKATIGYGSTEYENGKKVTMKDKPITKERAEELLRFEANAKAYVLNQSLQWYRIKLNQNQFDSLCSFSYNVGINGLLKSTLFAKIKVNPKDPTIEAELAKWNKGHKPNGETIIIDGLTKRRKKEAELYFFNVNAPRL